MATEAEATLGWVLPILYAALGLALGSFLSSVYAPILKHSSSSSILSILKVGPADRNRSGPWLARSRDSTARASVINDRMPEKEEDFADFWQWQLKTAPRPTDGIEDTSSRTTRTLNDCDKEAPKPDPYSTSKRQGYLSWDDYFMAIAFLSAHRSKDPNRQVGACLVSQDRVILGIGYNGFPRGCSDDELPWAKLSRDGNALETKYPYVCHAEVNAILNKNHASACGQRLYVTMFPCNECAKIIIQAGIAEVVYFTDKMSASDSYIASQRLLSMAGVKVWQHQPEQQKLVLNFK
ncbi:hypothetical protein KP509_11G061200 [Ceratopteris richardii]|uniref:dCMP deaminase n=1 Tax=Ceratopteris richardii TaxID=49495 RepID=A0A8T2TS36_CERRI|nr:hypothetical protein KP509_11G061200 [Ceratopteris richardii]KAH7425593.1 hypothetical protein KP509_11G061200 [Ceratopteris richardii]